MTIIWCGGEDIDFPNGGSVIISTSTSHRDTTMSRCAIVGSGTYVLSTQFSGISAGWVHANCNKAGGYTCDVMFGICQLSDGQGLFVTSHTNVNKITLTKYNGSSHSVLATESGTSLGVGGNIKVDIYFSGLSSSENVKVYVNGTLVIDFTGDVSLSGMSSLDCVAVHGRNSVFAQQYYFSEFIVADADTRLMHLKTLAPNAAGDTNDWGGAYTDVDEITLSDADLIYTPDLGDDFQANLTGMPAGTWKVKAVKVMARGTNSAQASGLKVGVKTNSAVHLQDSRRLGGAWAVLDKIFENNPETASAFTSGEIDALQIALRSDSTTTTTSTTSTTTTTA